MEHNIVKNPNCKEVNQVAIFTSVVKDLKSGLTENETENKVLRHISLKIYFQLLDHALSLKIYFDYINTLQKITNCASYKIMNN